MPCSGWTLPPLDRDHGFIRRSLGILGCERCLTCPFPCGGSPVVPRRSENRRTPSSGPPVVSTDTRTLWRFESACVPPRENAFESTRAGRPNVRHRSSGHPQNPLGVRALYLGSSMYRIHGTDAPWTIGDAVSKGCIRLYNEDVLDLYPRVPIGTRVNVTWRRYRS